MVISTESAQKVLCCNQAGLLHMCFDMNTCTFCLQPPRKNEAYNQGSYKWGFPTIRDPQVSMAPNQLSPSGLLFGTAGAWFLYDVVEYGLKQNDAAIFDARNLVKTWLSQAGSWDHGKILPSHIRYNTFIFI